MKHAVSISLGSSARNKKVEVELGGEKIVIERIGTDGDEKAARRMFAEMDGKVDAFGVGGLSQAGTQETPIASLETALRMDADAVAVSVFFGRDGDIEIYRWLAGLIEASQKYDMPVVAEMMPPSDRFYEPEAIAHAARLGMEIGADVVKTNYSGNTETFKQIVTSAPVPIIVAGGPSQGEDSSTVAMVRGAVAGGAAGVAIGRRVWQADDPQAVTAQIQQALFAD